ncbi:sensor histidine kinase [Pseudodesulfovibrio karagichevae]|uniref:histidine kinase n=1 Tax=Pseudodesulfovibrio karagichevae TaxID=3239305 RepID=A0ABV4K7E3_9BACT
MAKTKDLQIELMNLLGREDVDLDEVLTLTAQLAESDENRVRFSVDASHIDRLGRELVAKQETAVAELVKNGYDADAKLVELTFIDVDSPGGTLEIFDNGNGMTRSQLINGFMRLSTTDKADTPFSPLYKRARAGRKGIGRFAAQRLGTKLTIITQTKESPNALKISVDWNKYTAHKELATISHIISELPKDRPQGTLLVIENLRDSWSRTQISRAYRYTSELLEPYPLSKEKTGIKKIDPGFNTAFYVQQNGEIETVADVESVILKHAVGVVNGHIDDAGRAYWSFDGKKVGLEIKDQPIDINTKYKQIIPGGISFQAHYFIDDSDYIPTSFKTVVRNALQENGGIRLYRNGFRVLPFGEKYDDWLRLEHSSSLRSVLGPHRNTNFMGYVSVNDPEGIHFQETASREGLVENDAFFALREFVSMSLKAAAVVVAHERDRKPLPRQTKRYKSPEEALDAFMGKATKLSMNILDKRPDELKNDVIEMQVAAKEAQKLIEEIPMLRVLAGLGLMIGEFTHEIKLAFGAVRNALDLMRKHVSEEGQDSLEDLGSLFISIQSFARYFDHAVVDNAHRGLVPVDLVGVVGDFKDIVRPRLDELKIDISVIQNDYDLFTKPMHNSEWTSILFNLYSNSLKAIKKTDVKGKILVELGEQDGKIYLQFSDNGIGIPKENWEQVFDAFYTTSPQPGTTATYSEELTGSGLGLKVVKDIIRTAKGTIEVIDPPEGYTTSFLIEVPKALPEEIPDDAY